MPGLECEPLYEVLDRVPCKLKLSTALYVWHPEPQRKSGRLRVYSPEGSVLPSFVPYKTLSKNYKALSLIHPDATMRLPNQTYPTSHPSSISHVGESLNITLYIDSQQPISYRPIERADKVIVSFPAYRHPTQKPPPSVFVFQPAPTIFILSSTDSTIQRKYVRSGKHRVPRS